ncbi:hypothetical protein PGT21_050298 [Puccinia graminis f. sp. tritici]|uniref:BED-type domain-containing protein n=1 Tax=Puccinia graminis f. sp. tritici TaxID=56615 RepID=A0A5B0RXD5_PUCGR|nr:hypothetical protein PGT21_050298 [Puccinia graminis f. sp. tritici]KAA1130257.1 hypothetical protein PGTUg99_050150 [Puccinia graminis f. sp. tritici]
MKKDWKLAFILAWVHLHSLSASESPQNAESLAFKTNDMARIFGENASSEQEKSSLFDVPTVTSLESSRDLNSPQGAGQPRRSRGRPRKNPIGDTQSAPKRGQDLNIASLDVPGRREHGIISLDSSSSGSHGLYPGESTLPTASLQFNVDPSFESSGQGRSHIASDYQQSISPHFSGIIEGQQEYVNRIEAPTSSVPAGFGGAWNIPFGSSNAAGQALQAPAMLPPTSTHGHNTNFGLVRDAVQPGTHLSNTGGPIRKMYSVIWNFYNVVREGDEIKAECKYCKEKLVGKSTAGTSHLYRHTNYCLPQIISKMDGEGRLNMDKSLNNENRGSHFQNQISRELFTKMFIIHEYPLEMIGHDFFRQFVASLQPEFKIGDENEFKTDCMLLYNKMKTQVLAEISQIDKIALTVNISKSNDKQRHMLVSAHYLDNSWSVVRRVIGFKPLTMNHSGHEIAKQLFQTLKEWSCLDKFEFITLESSPSTDLAIKELKELISKQNKNPIGTGGINLQIQCASNTINMMVECILIIFNINLTKLRASIKYVEGTSEGKQIFEEAIKALNLESKEKSKYDVLNDWNSTYLLIDSSLSVRSAFENLRMTDPQFTNFPDVNEWIELKIALDLLKVFKKALLDLADSKNSTSAKLFKLMTRIKREILKQEIEKTLTLSLMAKTIRNTFNSYWKEMEAFAEMCLVMDPQSKLDFLEFFFYSDDKMSQEEIETRIKAIKNSLYDYYLRFSQSNVGTSQTKETEIQPDMDQDDEETKFKRFLARKRQKQQAELNSELDVYLQEPITSLKNSNIMDWWKSNSGKFPNLSKMAMNLLMVPMSSVTLDSNFSTGGRFLDKLDIKDDPAIAEALICTQDWLKQQTL